VNARFANSWYEASVRRSAPAPALAGDLDADVCVVGGGLSGCFTALYLAERGYRVVLLEAERIGFGASGRSGGQLIPGYASGQQKLENQLGAPDDRRLREFSVERGDKVRERVQLQEIDCDLARGHIHLGIKPRHRDEKK
jgi:gamma-glutamylputrescine oxidase